MAHTPSKSKDNFPSSPLKKFLTHLRGSRENLKAVLEQGTFLALDTTLTPELLQEGLARDFNRH